MMLTTNPHLVLRIRKHTAAPLLSLYGCKAWLGTTLPFYLFTPFTTMHKVVPVVNYISQFKDKGEWRYCYRHCGGTATCIVAVLLQALWRYCYTHCGGTATRIVAVLLHALWQYCYMHSQSEHQMVTGQLHALDSLCLVIEPPVPTAQ